MRKIPQPPRHPRHPVPPTPPAVTALVEAHLRFARAVARRVRAKFKFLEGSQDEADLESAALLCLVEEAPRWRPDLNPDFKAFASRRIRTEVVREAYRLRNAGTYHTTRTPELAPALAGDDVGEFDPPVRVENIDDHKDTLLDGQPAPFPGCYQFIPAGIYGDAINLGVYRGRECGG